MSASLSVPGPRGWPLLGSVPELLRFVSDPIAHVGALFEKYGPIVQLVVGHPTRIVSTERKVPGTVFLFGPEYNRALPRLDACAAPGPRVRPRRAGAWQSARDGQLGPELAKTTGWRLVAYGTVTGRAQASALASKTTRARASCRGAAACPRATARALGRSLDRSGIQRRRREGCTRRRVASCP